jgi:hypothetical protein
MDNGCLVEVDITVPPPVEVDITVPAPIDVTITPVPPIEVQIEQILVEVEITPPAPVEVVVSGVGQQGPPGPAGAGGVQDVFVQDTLPAQGATPWFLAQLDAPNGSVEFVKVYQP